MEQRVINFLERLVAGYENQEARLRRLEIEQQRDRDMLNELRLEHLQQQAAERADTDQLFN